MLVLLTLLVREVNRSRTSLWNPKELNCDEMFCDVVYRNFYTLYWPMSEFSLRKYICILGCYQTSGCLIVLNNSAFNYHREKTL